MWSRTEFEVGDRIPVSDWSRFWVGRVRGAVGASTFYEGCFGDPKDGWVRTIQAVNTGLVPPSALELFEAKVRRMTGLRDFATRYVEGLYGVDSRPDLRVVVYDRHLHPANALPLRRFLGASATTRARLAWSVAHKVFLALAEVHDRGLVHDEINLDTILVERPEPPRIGWRARLRGMLRARSTRWPIEDSFHPMIWLRGFALDHLLGHRALDKAHAAPERLAGEAPSAASDVYALGVVLHELLSGRCRRAGAALESLDDLRHGAPRWVAPLVTRLLDSSPRSRPGNPTKLAVAFQEAFLSEPETFPWMGPVLLPLQIPGEGTTSLLC